MRVAILVFVGTLWFAVALYTSQEMFSKCYVHTINSNVTPFMTNSLCIICSVLTFLCTIVVPIAGYMRYVSLDENVFDSLTKLLDEELEKQQKKL
jgi:hypothetical protein